jgi:hypothetical protein
MNKIKNFIKTHYLGVITCLIILLSLKSCNSCTSNRRHEFETIKYKNIIDSLQTVITNNDIEYSNIINVNDKAQLDLNARYDALIKEIDFLKAENSILKEAINDAKQDKEYYKRINNNLVNVTENLSQNNEIEDNN